MLNRYILELLDLLYTNKGNSISVDTLAENFNVSNRTIRNYCDVLEAFFSKYNLPIRISILNSQVVVVCNQVDNYAILNVIDQISFYDYRLNETERLQIITLLLLTSEVPVTLTSLENSIFIGRSTLQKDLQAVKRELLLWGIRFEEKKNKGIFVVSPESKIRNAIIKLISQIDSSLRFVGTNASFNVILNYFNNYLYFRKDRILIEKTIISMERELNVNLTDYDYRHLVLFLQIMRFRISNNKIIESNPPQDDQSNQLEFNMATYILNALKIRYVYLDNESNYLANFLRTLRFHDKNSIDNKARTDFYIIVKSFLNQISSVYGINLLNDQRLQQLLTDHLFWLYHRSSNNQAIVNPLKAQIVNAFIKDYQIIKSNINIFEQWIDKKLTEDEIVFILMHIIAGIERFMHATKMPNLLIACDISRGTATYLAEVIENSFPVKIIGVTSVHNTSNAEKDFECDLIISTSDLDNISTAWIKVNPIPSNEDFESIRKFLFNWSLQEHLSLNNGLSLEGGIGESDITTNCLNSETDLDIMKFSEIISPNHILLDVTASDWIDAILIAGEPMSNSGKVSGDYVQAMVENIKENGPYIVFAPGVAVAHASSDLGVKSTIATFLRLKDPVFFGHKTNDPVKFIIALALENPSRSVGLLSTIMNILCDKAYLDALSQAKDATTIIQLIKYFEQVSMPIIK